MLLKKIETFVLGTSRKLVSASFQERYVLLGVVVLLYSIPKCTIDVGKVFMRDFNLGVV